LPGFYGVCPDFHQIKIFGDAVAPPPPTPVLTSDGKRKKESNTRIGTANAVLCELHRSVVANQELSNTVKLSVFKSVFVPIVTYGHES